MNTPKILVNITGTPLPPELEALGITGILLDKKIQVSATSPEKTLARTKAIANYLCNHPSRKQSGIDPETGEHFEVIIGGTARWIHPDTGEEMETPIGEWARVWLNPNPTAEQLKDAEKFGMDDAAIVDWIIDPFNLIEFTSTPQTQNLLTIVK